MQVQNEFACSANSIAEQANKIPEAQSSLTKTPSSGKKPSKRKGGLSMFLAGKPFFPLPLLYGCLDRRLLSMLSLQDSP